MTTLRDIPDLDGGTILNGWILPPVLILRPFSPSNPMTPHVRTWNYFQVLPPIAKPPLMLPPCRGDEMQWDIRPIKRFPHDDTFIRMREHLPEDFRSRFMPIRFRRW